MVLLKKEIEGFEKHAITGALAQCSWVMAKAARQLGITERMIGYKIKKYGIKMERKMKRKQRTQKHPITVKID